MTYLNAAAERIFGYRADQVLGRELADVFLPPSAREAHRRGLTRHLATGHTRVLDRRIEVAAMRADGSEFPAELTVTRAGLPGAPAFIGYVRDITERQRAEEDLLTARQRLKAVADEQAALRRVATLVARGAPQEEVFAVVAREVASVLDLPLVAVTRFETGGIAVAVGVWGLQTPYPVGTSWRLDEHGASGRVYHSGRSARADYAHVPGPIVATLSSQVGIRSAVAVPIIVSNRTWGAMMALSTVRSRPIPRPGSRASPNWSRRRSPTRRPRQELRRLADEQAALRQVATLVAEGAEPAAVFDAVCEAAGRLVGATSVNLAQFTPDEMNLTQAGWSERGTHVPPGTRLPLDGESINALIRQSHAPVRVDSYEGRSGLLAARLRELGIKSEVGAPVVVDGEMWGALIAGTDQAEPQPADTEARLASFTDLVATAIANADAREELKLLADEQAALRRVATLVAGGAEPRTIFDAVCEETGRLIGAAIVNLTQFNPDGTNVPLAGWSLHGNHVPPGTRLPMDRQSVAAQVQRTRAPARVHSYQGMPGPLAARMRELGIRSGVGAPVIVDDSAWGALIVTTTSPQPLPAGTEPRLARFADLIGTAVSNATARAELIASRARMVTASDAARRRVTRDLHDGAQQHLVSTIINLQLAQQSWSSAPERAREYLDLALRDASSSIDGLREIAAGIHPAILTLRGLAAALEALADRLPLPVRLDVTARRLPEPIEASVYFFCSEALTNVVKHAQASTAWVRVAIEEDRCTIEVGDDGIGGAEARLETSGLIGLRDRMGALKGSMHISSPASSGTTLRAWLPLPRTLADKPRAAADPATGVAGSAGHGRPRDAVPVTRR